MSHTFGMFAVLLLAACAAPAFQQGGTARLRPPDAISCDRNQLTSFSGIVTQWSRDQSTARLSMNTDADTRESFTLKFEKGIPSEKWFLLEGELFQPEDWKKVEESPGRLKAGIQATVWACEASPNPIIDWRLPPR